MTMSSGHRLRAYLFALAALVLALACTYLASRSLLDACAVRAGVTQALARYEHPTADDVGALFENAGVDAGDLADTGIDVEAFAEHAFSHFVYEVQDVSVDGGIAEVQLQITNVDCQTLMAQLADEMAEHAAGYDEMLFGPDGERKLTEQYFAELCTRLDTASPVTSEVTIRLTRERGHWLLDGSSEDDLVRALFGEPSA